MAISEFTYKNKGGTEYKAYRVYRSWAKNDPERKRVVQKYYPWGNTKASQQKALQLAEIEDERLAQIQRAYALQQRYHAAAYFRTDGSVKGISLDIERKKDRNPVKIFKLSHVPSGGGKTSYSSRSIDKHGLEKAFRLSVEWICDKAGLNDPSHLSHPNFPKIKQAMMAAFAHYQESPTAGIHNDDADSSSTVDTELSKWEQKIRREVKAFDHA